MIVRRNYEGIRAGADIGSFTKPTRLIHSILKETHMFVLHCPACRQNYDPRKGLFACPNRQSGEVHILAKQWSGDVDLNQLRNRVLDCWKQDGSDSFSRLEPLLASATLVGNEDYAKICKRINAQLRRLEGKVFEVTPLQSAVPLAQALQRQGTLWIKNETENITGSHKGRHLMGALLYIEALQHLHPEEKKRKLAIYSCGNAALGASAVARAGGYSLHTFVPETVDPAVARRIRERDAVVEKVSQTGSRRGDPCYAAFRQAVDDKGWLPFSCAGSDNWANIEGGQTLGHEMALQLKDAGTGVSSVVLQVGGGALGRSVVQAWEEMHRLGLVKEMPRFYACQPEGGFPFVRAFLLVLRKIALENGLKFDWQYRRGKPLQALKELQRYCQMGLPQIREAIDFARQNFDTWAVEGPLMYVQYHHREFMWPWDGPAPHSLAHGILDDETYDWFHLMLGILKTGGRALILPEKRIVEAHGLARSQTSVAVCPTGSAGLAGLMQLQAEGDIPPEENVALIFSGKTPL